MQAENHRKAVVWYATFLELGVYVSCESLWPVVAICGTFHACSIGSASSRAVTTAHVLPRSQPRRFLYLSAGLRSQPRALQLLLPSILPHQDRHHEAVRLRRFSDDKENHADHCSRGQSNNTHSSV